MGSSYKRSGIKTVCSCTVCSSCLPPSRSPPAPLPYCITLCPRPIFKSSAGLANLTSSSIYHDLSISALQRYISNSDIPRCIGISPWKRTSDSIMPMKQAARSTTRAHHFQRHIQSISENSSSSKDHDSGPMTLLRAGRTTVDAPIHTQSRSHMPWLRYLAWNCLLGSAEYPTGTGELQRDLKLTSGS